jgi:hypothetical protein
MPNVNTADEPMGNLISESNMSGCYGKIGDILTVPSKFQIVKVFSRNDIVYYLAAAVDSPKRNVTMPGGFCVLNTEFDADDKLPDMPMDLLDQAAAYIATNFGDETPPPAEDGEDGEEEAEG